MRYLETISCAVAALVLNTANACTESGASKHAAPSASAAHAPAPHADPSASPWPRARDTEFDGLHAACGRGDARQCRALGAYAFADDRATAELAFTRACELGGIGTSDRKACLDFLIELQQPPNCPRRKSPKELHYPHCPSERKTAPKLRGAFRIRLETGPAQLEAAARREENLPICFAASLSRDPTAKGELTVSAQLDRTGALIILEHQSTLPDPAASECLLRQLAGLRVSPPPAAAEPVRMRLSMRGGSG